MLIVQRASGKRLARCFVLAKTVTGHALPLRTSQVNSSQLSTFLMAWTLLIQVNFGKNMFNLGFFNLIYRKSVL
jgi:hypothetical protein